MSTATDFHQNGRTETTPVLSPDTVQVLLSLIDSLTISMGNPQVEAQFAALVKARRELSDL
jgi:hypothetical protein